MNALFHSAEVLDTKKEIPKEDVSYEHAGYQMRVNTIAVFTLFILLFNGISAINSCLIHSIPLFIGLA